jgi:tRNA A-37 threonylcarbamoyl transferase component Bud32
MGFENGLVGSLVRLSVAYSPDGIHGPHSLVAKFSPSDDARRQAISERFGMFEREVRFYKELAPRVGVRVPLCYFAGFDPETQHSVILLEDLNGDVGDDEAGCKPELAQRAIEALAVLHARWWNSPALADLTWLRRDAQRNSNMTAMARERYPLFRERLGHAVPDHLWPLLDRVAIEPPSFVPGPITLTHGDASSKNMCFNSDESVTFFDWQLMGEAVPAYDVAVFLIVSMTPSDRRSSQRELLNAYHAALTKNGVTDYSVEQCARDVRLVAIARLRATISLGGNPTATTLALRTATRHLERAGAFFEDGGA